MASTLQGGGRDRVVEKGHGTSALGPSDTTDTGSDIMGGPGLVEVDAIGLDRGTHEDTGIAGPARTAGPDIGDADLNTDTDSTGTGERRTAGREPQVRSDADRLPDRVEHTPPDLPPAGTDRAGSRGRSSRDTGTS